MSLRASVEKLITLGKFPSESTGSEDHLKLVESLLTETRPPVTDDEAIALIKLFGDDSCFGAAWTLLHLIETAPGWPIEECLSENTDNKWIVCMQRRVGHTEKKQ